MHLDASDLYSANKGTKGTRASKSRDLAVLFLAFKYVFKRILSNLDVQTKSPPISMDYYSEKDSFSWKLLSYMLLFQQKYLQDKPFYIIFSIILLVPLCLSAGLSWVQTLLCVVCSCCYVTSNLSILLVNHLFWSERRQPVRHQCWSDLPGVTIIRCIRGLEENLAQNLISSLCQHYPRDRLQVLFCIESESDPAVSLCQDLIRAFPELDASVVIGGPELGSNPKLNALNRGMKHAKYDLIWEYDSNIFVEPNVLGRAAILFNNPKIGVVHHLPAGIPGNTSLGSYMETFFLNNIHARQYLFINYFRLDLCVMGKSNLYRKSDLLSTRALQLAANNIGEDYVLAHQLRKAGKLDLLSSDLVYQSCFRDDIRSTYQRRSRWIFVAKNNNFIGIALYPATQIGFNLLCLLYLNSLLIEKEIGMSQTSVVVFHLFLWFFNDVVLFSLIAKRFLSLELPAFALLGNKNNGDETQFSAHNINNVAYLPPTISLMAMKNRQIAYLKNYPLFLITWVLTELTAAIPFIWGMCAQSFEWRGRKYRSVSRMMCLVKD
eukprot:Lithocolla_globosa_v1_NODE_862_length_3171_cov_19.417843.p1 type:complete len:548 gc:universal NODE_862_length_3171_cov_19.417843:1691-48(-)